MKPRFRLPTVAAIVLALIAQATVHACPFCSAVSQTITEEISSMDVVAIANLVEPPPPADGPSSLAKDVPKGKFRIEQIIKGDRFVDDGETVETIYFGGGEKGDTFLLMAVDPPQLAWSTPLKLTMRAQQYIPKLLALPAKGPERLEFFQEYLEDKDEMLARDAYDEFAKAPYDEVQALEPKMDRAQLITWVKDSSVPASRRRLYLTMLGVCGQASDADLLEQLLRSNDAQDRAGLDALIGCYLTLKGAAGMPLIEELFLTNEEADYADTYAAIMALRFHGSETDVIPRERIVAGLRCLLDRPSLADLVIADLARWEDWGSMTKLVDLFKNADEKSSWVRVPVINYLRACPKPEAKAYLAELEKIDPAAVKRANTFFPFGGAAGGGDTSESSDSATTAGSTTSS